MDFRTPTPVGARINDYDFVQLKNGNGYDHNWVLNTKGDITRKCATLESPLTGIVLDVVQAEWDDTAKQNYAQWEADGGVYKIWLEDEQSLEEKLKVIKANDLAGVAEWSLGMENSSVWDLILQYVN